VTLDGVTESRQERIDRLYAEAEGKLEDVKAKRVQRGPISLIAVLLGLSLVVGFVAAVDLRRLQSPRGTALAWTGAAVFGDCTAYLELSVPDPDAVVPDRRSEMELCRDLRAQTEDARGDAPRIDIAVEDEAVVEGDRAAVEVRVVRPERTRSVVLELRRKDDGWFVVRTAPTCLAVGCA
jgi:hypothetical protein